MRFLSRDRQGAGLERQQEVPGAATQIEYARTGPRQKLPHPLHRAGAPAPVEVERQQMVQQVVVAGYAPEHSAYPARGLLLPACAARRGPGHGRTARMESSTRRSSSPVTMRTSPILTGSTKCTLPWTVFLSALRRLARRAAETSLSDGIGPY